MRWACSGLAAALLLTGGCGRTAAPVAQDFAAGSLCLRDEPIVFSCHLGTRIVSLCRRASAEKALVYRFGEPAQVAMTYPADGDTGTFVTSHTPEIGGESRTVSFTRAGTEYRVYSRIGRSPAGADPEFADGLEIVANGQVQTRVCDDGGEGFREDVDWLPAR